MASSPNDPPLQELKHDAVPGYFSAFIVALVVMGLYLAFILISSPGPAKGHAKDGAPAGEANHEAAH